MSEGLDLLVGGEIPVARGLAEQEGEKDRLGRDADLRVAVQQQAQHGRTSTGRADQEKAGQVRGSGGLA